MVVEGVLEAPARDVRRVLLDLELFGRWFPWLAEWRVLARGDQEARVYGRQDVPWPGRDRDYVARYRWGQDGAAFFLEATGVAEADPPAPRGVERVERFRSEWRVEPGPEGGSRVRYTAEGPVEGRIRRLLDGFAWRGHSRRVLDGLSAELERRGDD